MGWASDRVEVRLAGWPCCVVLAMLFGGVDCRTRSTSGATRSSTAPSTSRSSRPSISISISIRRKPRPREIVARMAERWNARLSRFFGHELRGRQSVILYAVSAHFRQTNAVEGLIGEGTGGVTEALKRRIVLPMSGSLADTDHVLGHELVHAFQFDHHRRRSARVDGDRARHPAVPAVVRRRDGRVPVARSGGRADGNVAARRGACARNCRTSATSTTPSTFPTAGATRSGPTSAPSTAIARWRR